MNLVDDAAQMQGDLEQLRQRLHATPEVGLILPRTQEIVLEQLDGLGLELTTGTRTTSVTGVLRGGRRDPENPATVLLRGDMDGLPVAEDTGLDFASTNGAMHACGHDFHTTSLVGAAQLLSRHRDNLAGDVVFMFQPGEEGFDGAGVMIDEGVLEASGRRPDAAYALHVISTMTASGVFTSRPGTMMSASHKLVVTVRGAGGHGSMPFRAKDPILAAAQMIAALETMITRTFDIFDPVVLSVGSIHGGTKANVIPETVTFEATVRRFSRESEELLERAITQTLRGVAHANGVDVDHELIAEYPVTINDEWETAFGADVVREALGEERFLTAKNPIAGSEDFSRVLEEIPGVFMNIGATLPGLDPASAPLNHSPQADFDPSVLQDGVAVYATLAERRLDLLAAGGAR
ncbi:M20 family metallopeptidase [Tsukamurella sp. NPDC003166]|uniref:M20 metallopeptidase family protein n=1 Tax=Tsukamurella sp. NPDC003166 TaxID=3154444 RepID=UPI0033ADFB33